MTHRIHRRPAAGLLALSLAAGAVAATSLGASSHAASSRALVGTFKLQRGTFSGGRPHGTYFGMLNPGGRGYFKNPDSTSRDKRYTLGTPGSDGGLVTGRFQPHPTPPFDGRGNAKASRIIRPQPFTSIRFGVASLRVDPQTRKSVAAPTARVSGRRLTLRIPGFTAEWNKQYFNQGAPKPNGAGAAATGTYDPRTRHFVVTWRSQVVGGPFNSFSGFWHLEGTFVPR
jgi:hypothetical protein